MHLTFYCTRCSRLYRDVFVMKIEFHSVEIHADQCDLSGSHLVSLEHFYPVISIRI